MLVTSGDRELAELVENMDRPMSRAQMHEMGNPLRQQVALEQQRSEPQAATPASVRSRRDLSWELASER